MNDFVKCQGANDLLTNTNIILEFDAALDGIKRYLSIDRKNADIPC